MPPTGHGVATDSGTGRAQPWTRRHSDSWSSRAVIRDEQSSDERRLGADPAHDDHCGVERVLLGVGARDGRRLIGVNSTEHMVVSEKVVKAHVLDRSADSPNSAGDLLEARSAGRQRRSACGSVWRAHPVGGTRFNGVATKPRLAMAHECSQEAMRLRTTTTSSNQAGCSPTGSLTTPMTVGSALLPDSRLDGYPGGVRRDLPPGRRLGADREPGDDCQSSSSSRRPSGGGMQELHHPGAGIRPLGLPVPLDPRKIGNRPAGS